MQKLLVLLSFMLISISNCYSQDFWERVNVPNDSPVRDIAVSSDGKLFTASIGMYKSSDNAESWSAINKIEYHGFQYDFFEMFILFQSVMVAKDSTIFISMLDGSMFKSTDDGQNWELAAEEPQNVKNIVQEENGRLYAFTGLQLYVSDDKGVIWRRVDEIGEDVDSPIDNYKMSIAPWGDIFVPYNGATIKKKDSTLFELYNEGLDSAQIRCFAFHNGIVYAGGDKKRGLFSSNDSGKTWSSITTMPDSLTVTALEFSQSGVLFAGTDTSGVFVSNDNGISWQKIEQIPKQEIYSIKTIDGNIYICTNGLYVSSDGGLNWSLKNNGLSYPSVGFYDFNSQSNHYAMTYYNFFRSDDNYVSWYPMNLPVDFRDTYFFLIDNEDNMYVSSYNKNWFYYSKDYGTTWEDINDLPQYMGTVNDVISLVKNSKGDIFIAFNDGESIYKSIDNGRSWYSIKQDNMLSRLFIGSNDELVLYNPLYGSSISKDGGEYWNNIIISPQTNDFELPYDILIDEEIIIFAGSETGFHISTDGGSTWENKNEGIAPNFENGPEGDIQIFKIQYINGIIYISTGSGIYFSDNLGDTWNEMNSGTVKARAVNMLYKKDNHLYVASQSGVYRSIDEIVDVDDGSISVGDIDFKIFPNPSNDFLNLSANSNQENKIRITLFDLSGNKVSTIFDGYFSNGNIHVPVKHISSGSYFLKLETNGNSKTTVIKIVR